MPAERTSGASRLGSTAGPWAALARAIARAAWVTWRDRWAPRFRDDARMLKRIYEAARVRIARITAWARGIARRRRGGPAVSFTTGDIFESESQTITNT